MAGVADNKGFLVRLDAVHIDVETSSEVDLPKAGLSRYARHPSTRVRVIAYRLPGEAITRTFDERDTRGPLTRENLPSDLVSALEDPRVETWAHNCSFERALFRHALGVEIPLESARCTMVWAHSLALPANLGDLGAVMMLSEDQQKLADGKRLIRLFCSPQKATKTKPGGWMGPETHPEEWQAFVDYCARDVDAEVEISRRLARWPMPEIEWSRWHLDQRINERGLPIDLELVRGALDVDETIRADLERRMRETTGVANPNSRAQLLAWLGAQGVDTATLTKQSVRDLLALPQEDAVASMLRSRLDLAKSSTTKYAAVERAVDTDGRLRGTLQFMGASRTGRWAGRTLQPQNLPQGVIDDPALMQGAIDLVKARDVGSLDAIFGQPSTILSSLIRAVIRAPEGKTLVAADYASIESIVLAWLAGCSRLLDVFRTGRDVYKDFATALYRIEYADVTKAQRKFAKPATLGCGYMLGAKGLVAYAEAMGVPMTLEQAKQCVDTFRASYFEIPILWNALDEAARACIRTGETTVAGKIRFEWSRPFLRMVLPSGRAISYLRPRIVTRETDWGPKSTVAYDGKDATGAWGAVFTHPGKFCIAAGTRVITARGVVPIECVLPNDAVWDGVEWVPTAGAVCNGVRSVIVAHGVEMTPDHFVLTVEGWRNASESTRLSRASCRLPNGVDLRRPRAEGGGVGHPLRLRHREDHRGERVVEVGEAGRPAVLRLRTRPHGQSETSDARDVEASSLRGLVVDARAMRAALASRVGALRRAWHIGLRALANELRDVLARYGAIVSRGVDARQSGQQRGIQRGELSVGGPADSGAQPAGESPDRLTGGLGGDRRAFVDAVLPVQPGATPRPVFDLVDCGPRHRFVVLDSNDEPLIVHNCEQSTQALARDLLAGGIEAAEAADVPVILHVHDEIAGEVDAADTTALPRLQAALATPPSWAPDMPLKTAGFVSPFYRKD